MTAPVQDPSLARRTLLRGAVAAGAATAASAVLAAPAAAATTEPVVRAPRRPTTMTRPTSPSTGSAAGVDRLHLLRRTTYGITPTLLRELDTQGADAWLAAQLDPSRIDDTACDAAVARFTYAHTPAPVLHAEVPQHDWTPMRDLQAMTLGRALWSKRQLFEVMVEFWSNHLNVTCPMTDVWATRGTYDRDVIRKHALGRFSDMLVASSTSPAMMLYLDNQKSQGKAPNENYGREVLELHTVGRDAGYGQAGVVAAARVFSGMTSWTPWSTGAVAAALGTFRYRPEWHYVGPVAVLGWSHPNASAADGVGVAESLLRYLAVHPATAARLARKLAQRFVSDNPPQALVDRLARVYLDSGSAIVPVLRALLTSPEFAAARDAKYARPFEGVVSTMRVLGITPSADTQTDALRSLVWHIGQVGHAPMSWHPPDGYPDVAPAWSGSGTVLGRWNLNVGLAQGWWKQGLAYPGSSLYARLLPGLRPASRAELVTALHARLMPGRTLPTAHRDALVTFLGGPGPVRTSDTGSLFSVLTALLLDSPAWSLR